MKQVKGNTKLQITDGHTDQVIDVTPPQQRPWYRLTDAGETINAYNYFKLYLQQTSPRNIEKLARRLGKHGQGLRNYSARFKWKDRAAAYDDFHTNLELERQRARREKQELEWLARRDEQRQQEWDIAQALLEKVRQMLQVPLFKETVYDRLKDLDPDGKIIIEQIVHFEPLDWSAVDIARYFEVASKMARLATGMDTDQKKLRIDVSALTDEQLEEMVNRG